MTTDFAKVTFEGQISWQNKAMAEAFELIDSATLKLYLQKVQVADN